jgi:hypothetical protein
MFEAVDWMQLATFCENGREYLDSIVGEFHGILYKRYK